MLGNFELAALVPTYGADLNTTATGVTGVTGNADPDSYIPRFEAAYKLKLGAGYIKPFGGVPVLHRQRRVPPTVTDDLDVLSWVLGISTSWNIGAFSIGGQVSYGANQGAVNGWATGLQQPGLQLALPGRDGDDINDVYTLQALIVPAIKFTDTLRFEAGFGYRSDDADDVNGVSKDEVWVAYVQALITMAPGVYLAPEVGYIDCMDGVNGDSQGYQWYVGAKWQIDF